MYSNIGVSCRETVPLTLKLWQEITVPLKRNNKCINASVEFIFQKISVQEIKMFHLLSIINSKVGREHLIFLPCGARGPKSTTHSQDELYGGAKTTVNIKGKI